MIDKITIKGAREHNLKDISLEIPKNKMTVVTGLSGSGKSSLAFDTIFAEGQRRYIESLSAYARQFLGQLQKPDVDEIEGLSPSISIDQKAHSANPRSTVATITEIYDYLRVLYARVGIPHCMLCNRPIKKLTSQEIIDAVMVSIEQVAKGSAKIDSVTVFAPVVKGRKGEYFQLLYDLYNQGFADVRIDGVMKKLKDRVTLSRHKAHTIDLLVDTVAIAWPLENNTVFRARLSEAVELALRYGEGVVTVACGGQEMSLSSKFTCPYDGFSFPEIEPRFFSFNSPHGACPTCHGLGTETLFSEEACPVCKGARLRPEALCVLVGGKHIVETAALTIDKGFEFFTDIKLDETQARIAEPVVREVTNRLGFLLDVGLDYLTLDRKAGTLSGGEAQRIRLASQIGSRLTGTLYVLDEPTIGLHQRDNDRLIRTLKELRDLGNTVVVVEHDPDTIKACDYLVDIGPGAGKAGGHVVAIGEYPKILDQRKKFPKSLTLPYLTGDKHIPVPRTRRTNSKEKLEITGVAQNNIKNASVTIPLKRFVCVTGVSGSGKSTLVFDVVHKALAWKKRLVVEKPEGFKAITGDESLDKVIEVDQSAIGRTPRSNPATYTGVFGPIRDLFALTPEARGRGYTASRFSFNVPATPERGGGRCEHCEGNGVLEIEMHFLPAVFVECDVCRGQRFDRETLDVTYKQKNIYEVLRMTIDEADEFFRDIPAVHDKLKVLREVGLGYLELGQSATTLSGGEAQRVKLAAELSRKATGKTLYLMDEPTVGLHYEDVAKLLEVIQKLVSAGNSVVVIEHNLDFIKCADYIIDMGPEGGSRGGTVIATGTPEDIAGRKDSYTGNYLKPYLSP